jgi:DNA-binding Lrp family transcriptional regulator
VHDRPQDPLGSELKKSYREIADKLGVDEDTVRNRVARLESTILTGWY